MKCKIALQRTDEGYSVSDGRAYCWRQGESGQLGIGSRLRAAAVGQK